MAVNRRRSRALKILGLAAIFIGLTYSFLTNGFAVAQWDAWSTWERGSEAMVLQRIEVDLLQRDASPLGLSAWPGEDFDVYDRLSPGGLPTIELTAPASFTPYESEIGGQAYFWSHVWRDLGCSSTSCLHAVSSALTAATVIALFLCLSLVGSSGLGWAWLISAACSPWITYAARNLFWSPWLYFLPTIAAVGLVAARSARWRGIALGGVFLAFVVKYVGTGYHEFTAFTMMAAAMPIIAVVFGKKFVGETRRQFLNSLLVLVSSALAFASVLAVHAYLLAGNVMTGVNQIWVNTVLRRTYGDAGDFDPAFAAGLASTPLEVAFRYVWSSWSTAVLSLSINKDGSIFSISLGRTAFVGLIFICVVIVIRRLAVGDRLWIRDATLLALGFGIPVIWFVAAKGYSYVHTHILFFLWYFLFVPALLFVAGSFAWGYRSLIGGWKRNADDTTESPVAEAIADR